MMHIILTSKGIEKRTLMVWVSNEQKENVGNIIKEKLG